MNIRPFHNPRMHALAADTAADPSRRRLLKSGGLTVAFLWLGGAGKAMAMASARPQAGDAAAAQADGNPAFAPNAFIRIDTEGPVRLVMPSVEMGQGAYTGEAMLLAEELGVGLDQIAIEHAPPNEALYSMPLLGAQITGGSSSIRSAWQVLREAGAVGRTMLAGAAAKRWGVDPHDCRVARGVIHHDPSGRQLTFGAVAQEAARQPVPKEVKLKDPKAFTLVGQPMQRVDTAGKVDGSTQFGIDVRVPGMKVATIKACPTFGGRLARVDEAPARALPGVRAVVKLDNAVAVIGDHYWAARKGLDALAIEWDRGPNADLSSDGIFRDMAQASQHGKAIVAREVGDVSGSDGQLVDAIYTLPMLAHAPMEPPTATVWVQKDRCDIWAGTQVPVRVQSHACEVLGFKPEQVAVHNQYIGGSFGRRLEFDFLIQAVAIARQVDYPVKLVWSREEDIQRGIYRPPYYDRLSARLGDDGLPLVWTDRITSPSVYARWMPQALGKDGLDSDAVECAVDPPYRLPNLRVEWVRHDPPPGLTIGFWRGVGPTHNVFTVEGFIDECAHAARQDPVAYRRALLAHNPRTLGVLDLAARRFDWDAGKPLPPRVGRGVAVAHAFGSYLAGVLEVAVSPAGEIQLRRCVVAIDCGITINPNSVHAQIEGGVVFGLTAALWAGITIEHGATQQSNFNDYRLLRINETPPIEVHRVESSEAPGGIGETGTVLAAPMLVNAIHAATGVRLRSYPVGQVELSQRGATDQPLAAHGTRQLGGVA